MNKVHFRFTLVIDFDDFTPASSFDELLKAELAKYDIDVSLPMGGGDYVGIYKNVISNPVSQ